MAKSRDDRQKDLLRPALEAIIDLGHAHQFERARRELKFLRTRRGPSDPRHPPQDRVMNRQGHRWRAQQEIAASDPLASLTPEHRLARVVELMARARALLAQRDPQDEDADCTDAECEGIEE